MTNIANWKNTILNGNIHYFNGDCPVRYVKIPEGISADIWFDKDHVGIIIGSTFTERFTHWVFQRGELENPLTKWRLSSETASSRHL